MSEIINTTNTEQSVYTKYINMCFEKINQSITTQLTDISYKASPTFYYMAIGSANMQNGWPAPNNRQEYPDYIKEYPFAKKVIILIDYHMKQPLLDSGYDLIKIDSIDSMVGLNNELPVYEHYLSSRTDQDGYPELEVYVVRQYIELLEYAYDPSNSRQIYIEHRSMLGQLVDLALATNDNSLFLVNAFNGYSYYQIMDTMVNLFPFDNQDDIRGRFLLEGTYSADHGCYYDLTIKQNQPIIDRNGRFYNPGTLSIAEFDYNLTKLLSDREDEIIFNIKKNIMLKIFDNLLRSILNQDYRTFRCGINEMKNSDPDIVPFLREEMLQFVEKALQLVKSFVNIQLFIEKQRTSDIYSDETEIKKIIDNILQ